MSELLLLMGILLLVLYYQAAMRCKEIATGAARQICKADGVQLLDQTVQQVRISMSRDSNQNWRVWRRYRFDYSTEGEDRNQGEVILLGHRVSSTRLVSPTIH